MSWNAGILWSKPQAYKRHSGTSQFHHTILVCESRINQKEVYKQPFSFAACREMTH